MRTAGCAIRFRFVLVAVCAFGATSVSSATASPAFLSHSTGKLLAQVGGSQVFTTVAGSVVCNALKLTQGVTAALQFLSILATVQYEACEAFGHFAATSDPFQYLIDANGLVRLETAASILVPGDECTITIPSSKNQSLTTVKFDNTVGGTLLLLWNISRITSSGAGTGCAYAEENKGTLEGKVHATVEGGTLKWDPSINLLPTATFLSHGTGKLLATADSSLIFFTPGGGLAVECTGLKLTEGSTTLLSSKSLLVTVKYEGCEIAGPATYHPFKYLIRDDGTAALENTVLILGGGCTITIPSSKNQTLSTVKVDNTISGRLLLLWHVTKVTSFGEGIVCPYAEESGGEFENSMQLSIEGGGVLRWDP
jgi:hypothetical protein